MFLNVNQHNENVTDLANCKVGESVSVSGMIHNVRVTKWGGFIVLRKSRGLLQAVLLWKDIILSAWDQMNIFIWANIWIKKNMRCFCEITALKLMDNIVLANN